MGGKVSNFNRSCEMIEGCLDIKKILGRNKTSTHRYPKCQFVEGNHKNHKGRRQTCNQSSQPCGISTSVTGFPNHGELPAGRNREEPPLIQLTSLCEQTVSNYHDEHPIAPWCHTNIYLKIALSPNVPAPNWAIRSVRSIFRRRTGRTVQVEPLYPLWSAVPGRCCVIRSGVPHRNPF